MPDAESADHFRQPSIPPDGPMPLYGFNVRLFSHAGMTHPVYRSGSGPAVLVLHEATGLSPHAVDLGRRLIQNGFTAYLPLFFGRPYHGTLRGAVRLFCIQREFRLFASNPTSPIADWLRGLCWRADQDSGRLGVAVVGMCLTGGVALATVVRPEVRAVVSAQPALPVPLSPSARASLGLSQEDLKQAQDRNKPVLALRFKRDLICPAKRIQTMQQTLGAEAIQVPRTGSYRDYEPKIRRCAHSVLTVDLADVAGHPTREALDAVLGFLRRQLLEGS